jgi:hypothetical protein
MTVGARIAIVAIVAGLAACGGGGEMETQAPAAAPAAMPAEPAAQPPAETPAPPMTTNDASLLAEPTWAVLFAGQDLMSFNPIGGANWQLVDGIVQADGGDPGFLVTKGAYTDFRIRVEFQASAASNSGVFIRCEDPNAVSAETCYEVNIFDQNQNPNNLTGAIVNLAPPATAVTAGDQWNTFDITAEGDHLVVRFNDTVTVDVRDTEHARGYIALQYNGGPIKFRNVSLRPL